jgi:hypothetical protein
MIVPSKVKQWRSHQRRGSIMKAKTFKEIEHKAMKEYHIGKKRAAAVASAAYWKSVRAKFKETH